VRDARDLVVLAVGGAYLQVIATKERVKSARAQFETANALYQQNAQKRSVGLVVRLTSTGAKSKRLLSNTGHFIRERSGKTKISLARMTGLPKRRI